MIIEINDKELKTGLTNELQWSLFDEFEDKILIQAGVPKIQEMVKSLMENDNFQKTLAKRIKDQIDLSSVFGGLSIPTVDAFYKKCEKIQGTNYRQEEIRRATDLLKESGYKVTK